MASELTPQPHGGAIAPRFSSTYQPGTKRLKASERHADVVTRAQDLMAKNLEEVARAAVDIALGNAVEHLVNHKTGVVHEVPVQPATRLKAQAMVIDRIMGKPEQTKTHEIGENAGGLFRVLLGAAATEYLEATYGEVPAEAEALEAAPAPGLLTETV